MKKEDFEKIIEPIMLLNGKESQFIRNALLKNFEKWKEEEQLALCNVVGRSEQLVCEHEWVWENPNEADCMKRRCERCGERIAN